MPPDASDQAQSGHQEAADRAWSIVRRIHFGVRRPANWAKLFKFGVVGASGYVINLIVFALLTQGLDVHHLVAAVGAFCVAVTNNFVWNRAWTFRDSSDESGVGPQAARFLAVSIAGLGVNLVLLTIFVDALDAPALPSQALAVALAMPVNFICNKMWTFGWG